MSDATREATCPCAGRCHHDTHPCSLGCWAAQKPWRAEEAALSTSPAPDPERLAQMMAATDGREVPWESMGPHVRAWWIAWAERLRGALEGAPHE